MVVFPVGTCSRDYECAAHQTCKAEVCTCLPGFEGGDDECIGIVWYTTSRMLR